MGFSKVVASKNAINIFNLHGKKPKPENGKIQLKNQKIVAPLVFQIHKSLIYCVWYTDFRKYEEHCAEIYHSKEKQKCMFADKYVLLPLLEML